MSVSNASSQTFTNGQVTAGTATLANGTCTYAKNTAFTTASLFASGEIQNSDGATDLTFQYTGEGSTPAIATRTMLGSTATLILVSATTNGPRFPAWQTLPLPNPAWALKPIPAGCDVTQ